MSTERQKPVVIAILLGTLAGTAFFIAQGTTGLLAASLLELDGTMAVSDAPRASAVSTQRRRDDTQILRRNIFDSETGPLDGTAVTDVELPEPAEPVEELDPNAPPPPCEGSIRLVASVVNPRRDDWSFAAIIGASGRAMLYRVGQDVDDKPVVAIQSNMVILQPGGSYCSLSMFGEEEAVAAARATATARPTVAARRPANAERPTRPERPSREGAITSADMEAGINRNSDSNFTIQRGLVDQILENQAELMRTARIIPHEENGRVVGVKMYGIRRNSLLGRLGIQNGDMMRTINGYDLSSPDSALEAYARLRNADNLSVAVVRRGQPMTIDYNIQ